MAKHHPKNERVKHRYAIYLEEARGMTRDTVNAALAAIGQFEETTGHRGFAGFRIEQAQRFKRRLRDARNARSGKPLSASTIRSRLLAAKAFFVWLADQPGYKSKIRYADCDYFHDTANETRIATARREPKAPTLEMIRTVLDAMPRDTAVERRNRALIAFAILSGARDDAIASLNIGHVDVTRRTVFQDARAVRTKNRKTFTSAFFPVGSDIEEIVAEWLDFLKHELLFGPDDPLFPKTSVSLDEHGQFAADGLVRQHWANADAIRKIFRRSFEAAGLPYYNPHSLRRTLTLLGERVCATPEEFRAWSQNLGHDSVMTTLTSYGTLSTHRQTEIMNALARATRSDSQLATDAEIPSPDAIRQVVAHLNRTAVQK